MTPPRCLAGGNHGSVDWCMFTSPFSLGLRLFLRGELGVLFGGVLVACTLQHGIGKLVIVALRFVFVSGCPAWGFAWVEGRSSGDISASIIMSTGGILETYAGMIGKSLR
jgi:hypothetical protein